MDYCDECGRNFWPWSGWPTVFWRIWYRVSTSVARLRKKFEREPALHVSPYYGTLAELQFLQRYFDESYALFIASIDSATRAMASGVAARIDDQIMNRAIPRQTPDVIMQSEET